MVDFAVSCNTVIMADKSAEVVPGDAPEGVSALKRVGAYSPVVVASDRAQQYYSMAKELWPSGVERAEASMASLSAVLWYEAFGLILRMWTSLSCTN